MCPLGRVGSSPTLGTEARVALSLFLCPTDASARATFRNLLQEWREAGIQVCMAGTIGPVRDTLASDGFLDEGSISFQLNVDDALAEFERPGTVSRWNQAMAQQHSTSDET